jgi:hypothetical protein
MEESPRQLRLSSTLRGVIIGALLAVYFFVVGGPGGSFAVGLLIAAVVQVVVLLLRKFLPSDALPQAQFTVELLADGATVLLFALGVYGGILRLADQV